MHSIIKKLAKKNHSFFLYNLDKIREQIESLRSRPKNVELFYAMKANPHPKIISYMLKHPEIQGIEIASQGEAQKVLAHTKSLKRVMFTSPGKRSDELDFVMKHNIAFINVESLAEAYRIQEIARKKQTVLLRINTNREIHGAVSQMSSTTKPSPFGVAEEKVINVIRKIHSLDKLQLEGLHIFSATGVLDARALLAHIQYAFILTKKIETMIGQKFKVLDFGGGIGIDYEGKRNFNALYFMAELQQLIAQYHMQDKRLVFELGRYIVADAGYFCTTINDIKESRGMKILICTAGINAHRRPYALKVNYPIEILFMEKPYIYEGQPKCMNEIVQIRGPLCTEADVLSYSTHIREANIGDIVIMSKSGAYGLSMSALDFLSHPHVPEFIVGGKHG